MADEYPKLIRIVECPECDAPAMLEEPEEDAEVWVITCTENDSHVFGDSSRGGSAG